MAVMSFAHLKNRKTPETRPETPASFSWPSSQPKTANTAVRNDVPKTTQHLAQPTANPTTRPGVLSFAHLKNNTVKETAHPVTQGASSAVVKAPARSTYRIPAVMLTARLQAVNYCYGCSRFLPSSDWEKQHGNPYGRCLREERLEGEINGQIVEVWKVIPAAAPVYRCWYHINQKK